MNCSSSATRWPNRAERNSHFHANPMHTEALARLHFLAENRSRLGVLLGDAGSGKTTLLERFAGELRDHGAAVALVSCLGLDPYDLLASLASQWNCGSVDDNAPLHQLWRRVTDRIIELGYEHVPAVLLLDDAQAAAPDVIAAIERMTAADSASGGRLTIVCTADPEEAIQLGLRLLDLAELRIELPRWDVVDVQEFVTARGAGNDSPAFDAAAMLRLQELSGGLPRKVRQLAQLAELACASQQMVAIDASTIDAVYEELSLAR